MTRALGSIQPVPGPPRGRRQVPGGDLRERVERMRRQETAGPGIEAGPLLRLLRDVILLVKDVALDPRVPARVKVVPAGIALACALSPVRRVPRRAPQLRPLDDVLVVCWAARRLLRGAGYERVYESWRGSPAGLAVVLSAVGIE